MVFTGRFVIKKLLIPNDSASFTWTPPGEGSSSNYVCASWTKTIPYLNRATISATFREVFEP